MDSSIGPINKFIEERIEMLDGAYQKSDADLVIRKQGTSISQNFEKS